MKGAKAAAETKQKDKEHMLPFLFRTLAIQIVGFEKKTNTKKGVERGFQ